MKIIYLPLSRLSKFFSDVNLFQQYCTCRILIGFEINIKKHPIGNFIDSLEYRMGRRHNGFIDSGVFVSRVISSKAFGRLPKALIIFVLSVAYSFAQIIVV